jgi:hypothetical protein
MVSFMIFTASVRSILDTPSYKDSRAANKALSFTMEVGRMTEKTLTLKIDTLGNVTHNLGHGKFLRNVKFRPWNYLA